MLRKEGYKDMEKYRKTRNAQKRRYYRKTIFSENSKKHYTSEELSMILEHKITDMELSKLLGRSVGSIQTKRRRLKQELNLV